jgi:hypothetical protein
MFLAEIRQAEMVGFIVEFGEPVVGNAKRVTVTEE